ncbi:MAG: SLC13 family permease, partial [Planctomycetes bacterium]|nr:SLC13 family permease [Planctomycetota bacterium]
MKTSLDQAVSSGVIVWKRDIVGGLSSTLIFLPLFLFFVFSLVGHVSAGQASQQVISAGVSTDQNASDHEAPQTSLSSEESKKLTTSAAVTLGIIGLAVLFFLVEPVPLFVMAVGIPVLLAALEPWTKVGPSQAISGVSSQATITILAMFVLSEGIRRTGLIQIVGETISNISGSSIVRQVATISGLSGPIAGIINNTPVVAIFIPMVSNLARKVKTSPSKLMIPLSYASMMGGTLTLIGSSTNLLASDISERLLGHPFSFFEFTGVGLIILGVGVFYLVIVGHHLLPERLDPKVDLAEEYEMGEFLTELILQKDSRFVGMNVKDMLTHFDFDLELVQITRGGEKLMEPFQDRPLEEEDRLVMRTNRRNLLKLLDVPGLELFSEKRVSEEKLEEKTKGQTVIQTVVPRGSFLEGETLED